MTNEDTLSVSNGSMFPSAVTRERSASPPFQARDLEFAAPSTHVSVDNICTGQHTRGMLVPHSP